MKPRRTKPRLNLRFPSLAELDTIERQANLDGLDLQNWLRQLVRQEMTDRQFRRLLIQDGVKSVLIIQDILEQLVDASKVEAAHEKADRRMERLDLQSKNL